jgi:hypothetical protein
MATDSRSVIRAVVPRRAELGIPGELSCYLTFTPLSKNPLDFMLISLNPALA